MGRNNCYLPIWRGDSKGLRGEGATSHFQDTEGTHTSSQRPIRRILETEVGNGSRIGKLTQEPSDNEDISHVLSSVYRRWPKASKGVSLRFWDLCPNSKMSSPLCVDSVTGKKKKKRIRKVPIFLQKEKTREATWSTTTYRLLPPGRSAGLAPAPALPPKTPALPSCFPLSLNTLNTFRLLDNYVMFYNGFLKVIWLN